MPDTAPQALLAAGGFPELVRRRRKHEELTIALFSLAERYERGEADITEEVMAFLKAWLVDHILHEDKKLEGYFRDKGLPAGWGRADRIVG